MGYFILLFSILFLSLTSAGQSLGQKIDQSFERSFFCERGRLKFPKGTERLDFDFTKGAQPQLRLVLTNKKKVPGTERVETTVSELTTGLVCSISKQTGYVVGCKEPAYGRELYSQLITREFLVSLEEPMRHVAVKTLKVFFSRPDGRNPRHRHEFYREFNLNQCQFSVESTIQSSSDVSN